MTICINGKMFETGAARIDPSDRGFTLDDGIYKTIAIRNGQPRRLARHLARRRECLGDPNTEFRRTNTRNGHKHRRSQ
jgi:branched-subunit amino acid aminotransferase/4-amino-4-deoxychorismate lyase